MVELQNIDYKNRFKDPVAKGQIAHCPDKPMGGRVGSKSGKIPLWGLAEVSSIVCFKM